MNYPQIEKLIQIIKDLRHPETGCPWDKEQTHQTLTKYALEEAYEFVHEVEKNNDQGMKEELGDVLLQVVLHAVIAEQRQAFTIEDIAKTLGDKLIERHPHVFGEKKELTPVQVTEQWQEIKLKNKKSETLIEDKVLHFAALESAHLIGKKTKDIKFDWDHPSQVSYKVEEEWQELKEELAGYPQVNLGRVEEELGDLLFSIAQLSRHLKINPEFALRKANQKFLNRFQLMEKLIQKDGKNLLDMNQDQMDVYWLKVKQQLKHENIK